MTHARSTLIDTLHLAAQTDVHTETLPDPAAAILSRIHPTTVIGVERKALARDLLVEVRRHDRDLDELARKIRDAVTASGTTVTDVHGVGPIMAAYILGHTRDIRRFRTAGHYARYNATAPISASTSADGRHRLNPYSNRQLNHAMHIAAVAQAGHDTPGRVYYRRKIAEGNSRKEALRALKRQIPDAVYRQLVADANH